MKNLKLIEKQALIINILFISSIIIGRVSEYFRFISDLRWIYQTGKFVYFILLFTSFLWSIINAIFIIKEKENQKGKLTWTLINFAPFLYFIIMIIF